MLNNQFVQAIVAGLSGHPEAVLAFAMTLVSVGLLFSGFDVLIAGGLPAGFYLVYSLRMMWNDKHIERLEEIKVRKIETELGKTSRRRNIERLAEAKQHGQDQEGTNR